MLRAIDRTTISISENGMYEFGEGLRKVAHLKGAQRLIGDTSEDDDLHSMFFEQIKRVMLFTLSLYGVATIVFIGEIIVFRWKKWRHRKHRDLIISI